MSQNQIANTPTPSWRDLREQERQERRGARGNGGWIFGLVLVLVGGLLLLQNMNVVVINNWWALFILLPAFGSLAGAWQLYSRTSQVSAGVISSFMMGLLFLGMAVVFLFNLTARWELIVPALLIIFGVSMLLPSILGKR